MAIALLPFLTLKIFVIQLIYTKILMRIAKNFYFNPALKNISSIKKSSKIKANLPRITKR